MQRVAVVGGGVAGLTVAHRLLRRAPHLDVTLFERAPAVGGLIGTHRQGGRLVELGPNGFLDSKAEILELCDELGLMPDLERAKPESAERFVLVGGRLRRVPKSPVEFLTSNVLSVPGKLRFLWERFAGKASGKEDESISDFGRRHFGAEATDHLLDAVVTGIYAGDIEKLSIRSSFPKLVELEARFGSLLKAQGALAKERRKAGQGGSSLGTLTCPRGGMGRLVERLRDSLGDRVRFETAVGRVERVPEGWRVVAGSDAFPAECVVLASPAHAAAELLAGVDGSLAPELRQVEAAPAVVVALAFKREDLAKTPVGFGFLAPERLGRPVLGVIYSSNVFADQAPPGEFMFRAILGGDRRRDVVSWNDDQLVQAVRNDLRELLRVEAAPVFQRVQRWDRAIPQYHVGHGAWLARIEERLNTMPGLFLTGASYRGVSVADCVKDGLAVAGQVAQYLERAFRRTDP